VAVIGAGIIGCTVAWRIREALGYDVDLYERRNDILLETSAGTSNRVHHGYQYARSPETASSLRAHHRRFTEVYGSCIVPSANYYGVADDSPMSPADYVDFCTRCDLPIESQRPQGVFTDHVRLSLLSREQSLDPAALRTLCRERLQDWGVRVISATASRDMLDGYEHVIAATYANPNLLRHPQQQQDHHFSLYEVMVVELPGQYAGLSAMVVYGPFMTVDVLGTTGGHVLYHAHHGVHHVNVGPFAEVPTAYQPLLYRFTPADELDGLTHAPRAFAAAWRYFRGMDRARHTGSTFVVRVQAPSDVRDAVRRTTIDEIRPGWYSISAAKLSACVSIADTVVARLHRDRRPPRAAATPRSVSRPAPAVAAGR
jgi:hypothetical protein